MGTSKTKCTWEKCFHLSTRSQVQGHKVTKGRLHNTKVRLTLPMLTQSRLERTSPFRQTNLSPVLVLRAKRLRSMLSQVFWCKTWKLRLTQISLVSYHGNHFEHCCKHFEYYSNHYYRYCKNSFWHCWLLSIESPPSKTYSDTKYFCIIFNILAYWVFMDLSSHKRVFSIGYSVFIIDYIKLT